jgi:putative ABC transport system permease protein
MMSLYLAFKEIWRSKGRFFLFSLVIALITTLVLFIAALAGGLASANKEYIEKIDAELLVFQENVDLLTTSSRIGRSRLNDIRRVDGVEAIGPIGFSSASIVNRETGEALDISLIGVEPGKPGDVPALEGRGLRSKRTYETVIDKNVVIQTGLQVGDEFTLKTIQGTEEEYFDLKVIGITDKRQYFFQPSITVPFLTWDKIRPQAVNGEGPAEAELVANIVAVKLENPAELEAMSQRLVSQVDGIEVADIETAIQAIPGYSAQQSTLNTQRGFTLFIGVLVLGGFFQIQTLQKVPQIGMLKAIGAANATVAAATLLQIILVTIFGVLLGAISTLGLSAAMPAGIPIIFTGNTIIAAIVSLLLIGPAGGLVSIRLATKVEPLTAIGL